jgi:translation initiation factor 3 subunit H
MVRLFERWQWNVNWLFKARYQASMLRSLKEVQADDSVVGFYQATTLGAFLNQTLVDTQAIHQDKLRHGGVVIVHGE